MPKSAERCAEERAAMREKILQQSVLYFARNGFSGTKISDLAHAIGIGQGTIYLYFKSKEELFSELQKQAAGDSELAQLKLLAALPLTAKQKLHQLSGYVLNRLEKDEHFAGAVALHTQMMLSLGNEGQLGDAYESELYLETAKIIAQAQREATGVPGNPLKLADYYWGVVYLYALKKLFTTRYETIAPQDLARTVLHG